MGDCAECFGGELLMANYLTTDTDLTAVADAIRAKGRTSGLLAFPQGFVDAIEDISGGGGGVDLSELSTNISQNTLGGLFQAFMDGTWGTLELSVVSGTNPIIIDFGRAIKGFVFYPKSITVPSGLSGNANTVVQIDVFQEPTETGQQNSLYFIGRTKTDNNYTTTNIAARVNSWTFVDGVLSLVPSYPSNVTYHPFGFNKPYTFVYWWEE